MSRRSSRLIAVAASALVLTVLPLSGIAGAAVTCSIDTVTKVATVNLGAAADNAVIKRSGANIQVNAVNCSTATVTTTDTINVTGVAGDHVVTIDLTGGAFGPGFTVENADAPNSEIEMNITLAGTGVHQVLVVGTTGIDTLRLGANRLNLNGAEPVPDTDVTIPDLGSGATNKVTMRGGLGADKLSGSGGLGTPGSGVTVPYEIDGEGGDDVVSTGILGAGGATLAIRGGADNDKITNKATSGAVQFFGDAGIDELRSGTAGGTPTITLDGGPDKDLLVGSGLNETLLGQAGVDNLQGKGGNDTLNGGTENDAIQPGLGVDVADGGAGVDTAGYQTEAGGVTVNLATGTKTGVDSDTLTAFENVTGGAGIDNLTGTTGDNRMLGGNSNDTITASSGADVLLGGDGGDSLSGGIGNDNLQGGPGDDLLDGGPDNDTCSGGPGTDNLQNCSP